MSSLKKSILSYHVGQRLWFVPNFNINRSNREQEVEVVKVGIKWVSISILGRDIKPMRFDPINGRVDGGKYSSPGTVYFSREIYDAEKLRCALWRRLSEHLRCNINPPAGLSLQTLQQVIGMLGAVPSNPTASGCLGSYHSLSVTAALTSTQTSQPASSPEA